MTLGDAIPRLLKWVFENRKQHALILQLRDSKRNIKPQSAESGENVSDILDNYYEEPFSQDTCEEAIDDDSYHDQYEIASSVDDKTIKYSKLKRFKLWFNDMGWLWNENFRLFLRLITFKFWSFFEGPSEETSIETSEKVTKFFFKDSNTSMAIRFQEKI